MVGCCFCCLVVQVGFCKRHWSRRWRWWWWGWGRWCWCRVPVPKLLLSDVLGLDQRLGSWRLRAPHSIGCVKVCSERLCCCTRLHLGLEASRQAGTHAVQQSAHKAVTVCCADTETARLGQLLGLCCCIQHMQLWCVALVHSEQLARRAAACRRFTYTSWNPCKSSMVKNSPSSSC